MSNPTPSRNVATVPYWGQQITVACDRQCQKAWGITSRPSVPLSDDPDDIAYLADSELGEAPADPGTYEGGVGKPRSPDAFPTKWCVRQCERCAHAQMDAPITLTDWSQRSYNQPWKHPQGEGMP